MVENKEIDSFILSYFWTEKIIAIKKEKIWKWCLLQQIQAQETFKKMYLALTKQW